MVGSVVVHEVNASLADAFKAVFKHVVEDGFAFRKDGLPQAVGFG